MLIAVDLMCPYMILLDPLWSNYTENGKVSTLEKTTKKKGRKK